MEEKLYNISDLEMEDKLEQFQGWVRNHPEFPQKIEKLLLLRFLKTTHWRLEKAQRLLKYSLELRGDNQHIFSDRDPLSDEIQNVFKAVDMVPLLSTTPENYKVCIFRLIEDDFDDIEFNDVIKTFFIMSDVRLISPDLKTLTDGEIPIFDLAGVSYRHLSKVVLSTVRLYLKYTQEAHPVQVKQIHILNCTPIMDRIMGFMRPFMKTEVAKMINFHPAGLEKLHQFIPKDILPQEYGGNAGPIDKMKQYWINRIENHRDYLMNEDNWKISEDLIDNELKTGGIMDLFKFF